MRTRERSAVDSRTAETNSDALAITVWLHDRGDERRCVDVGIAATMHHFDDGL